MAMTLGHSPREKLYKSNVLPCLEVSTSIADNAGRAEVTAMKKLLYLILCVGQFASAANNYYVSTVGNDSNDGSQAHPWATIQHAVNSNTSTPLDPTGAIIHVAAGTYNTAQLATGADPLCARSGCSLYHIFIGKSGASDSQRLVLQCDLQFQCLIRPSDNVVQEGIVEVGECCTYVSPGGAFVDVVGFDIAGTATGADSSHYTQAGLELMGNASRAIGNYVHHILKYTNQGGYGIYASASATTTGCVDACPTNSIPANSGQQIIGNVVVDVGVPAGTGDLNSSVDIYASAPNEIIENNIIYNNPAVVTTQGCISSNHWGLHSVTSNNTINCNDTGASVFVYMADAPFDGNVGISTMTYDNNVVIHSQGVGYAFREGGTVTSSLFFGNNACDQTSCVIHPGTTILGTISGTITSINPATFFAAYNSSNQYPMVTVGGFTINPGGTDYDLKSGNAAIGTTVCVSGGITPCVPTTDFAGRAISNPPPIGAYADSLVVGPSNLTAITR
jgi:hypothetical protein